MGNIIGWIIVQYLVLRMTVGSTPRAYIPVAVAMGIMFGLGYWVGC